MQSPIKLLKDNALALSEPTKLLEIIYPPKTEYQCTLDPKGHGNFQVASGPSIKFRGVEFKLALVHIHSPAEHLVETDDPEAFEVHFVHVPVGGTKADRKVVIGIIYEESTTKSLGGLADFAKNVPNRAAAKSMLASNQKLTYPITPTKFFPIDVGGDPDLVNWFHYEGSLTGFPYSEDVSWFVMRDVAHVNPAATADLKNLVEHHARELQPLARRLTVKSFLNE
jgi:carbonic anhydrase